MFFTLYNTGFDSFHGANLTQMREQIQGLLFGPKKQSSRGQGTMALLFKEFSKRKKFSTLDYLFHLYR